jgi:hypothetical protein
MFSLLLLSVHPKEEKKEDTVKKLDSAHSSSDGEDDDDDDDDDDESDNQFDEEEDSDGEDEVVIRRRTKRYRPNSKRIVVQESLYEKTEKGKLLKYFDAADDMNKGGMVRGNKGTLQKV